MSAPLPHRVVVGDGVLYRKVGGGGLLLDHERDRFFGLDAVGAVMWELLAEQESTERVVDALVDRYGEVDRATLERDLAELVEGLTARGLLVGEPGSGEPAPGVELATVDSDAVLRKLGVVIERGFLTREECEALCHEMRAAGGEEASLEFRGKQRSPHSAYRSTLRVEVSEATKTKLVERIRALQPRLREHFGVEVARLIETPKFLRYREGDFFVPHRDVDGYGSETVKPIVRARRINVVLFLNDASESPGPGEYTGCGLSLYGLIDEPTWREHGFPVRGQAGTLVAFPADLLHEVAPVEQGERYCVVSRLLDPSFDETYASMFDA